ncbi:MAG: amidophosphoribosyltransferase [Lachnospiraceae bacterium]|nr:amidophosphoribosyltransferase [Lachnospiraceae bacterium]
MGGFFGVVSKRDCLMDVFFGVDYHSHLGTKSGGLAVYDPEQGMQRTIHHIDSAPFRTKFENIFTQMKGTSAIGSINDTNPQPLLIRSTLGTYGLCFVGVITNKDELIEQYMDFSGGVFSVHSGGEVNSTELVAALIGRKSSFAEGIRFAQQSIQGSCSMLILKENGNIIAARDYMGRLPVIIAKDDDGYAVSFESYAAEKVGYEVVKELGSAEIVEISTEGITVLAEAREEMKICSFLWSYYGYPTSVYEGVNVEVMRYRNGATMAQHDKKTGTAQDIDYVGGVPDSGTPHAIGYSNKSGKHFARAFIKYTPTWSRSFMPPNQKDRDKVAKMKQIPVMDLIRGKKLLFVDDSIVRGTQLRETVDFLYENGAKEVHIRSACPPIMYGCKFLNFSRSTSDMELIARRVIMELEGPEGFNYIEEYINGDTERGQKLRKAICEQLHFDSLEFQSLEGLTEAIGIDPNKLCTYCWNGKEH